MPTDKKESQDDCLVTITPEEYKELIDDQQFLYALQACGVDNWEGYSEAQAMMED